MTWWPTWMWTRWLTWWLTRWPLGARQDHWKPTKGNGSQPTMAPGANQFVKVCILCRKVLKFYGVCLLWAKILFTSPERFFSIFTLGAKDAFCGSLAGRWCALHCAVCIFWSTSFWNVMFARCHARHTRLRKGKKCYRVFSNKSRQRYIFTLLSLSNILK